MDGEGVGGVEGPGGVDEVESILGLVAVTK